MYHNSIGERVNALYKVGTYISREDHSAKCKYMVDLSRSNALSLIFVHHKFEDRNFM